MSATRSRSCRTLLAELAEQGCNVDFVLVDGDHSRDGVAADLGTLLASPAIRDTVILLHDSFNPWVRLGIDAVDPWSAEKVGYCELDFLPGRMAVGGGFDGQLWAAALILTGAAASDRTAGVEPHAGDAWETAINAAPMLAAIRAEQAGRKPPHARRALNRARYTATKWRSRLFDA